MNYAAIKAADAALGIADIQAATNSLNAQRVTVVVDIPTADARSVLLLSGEWFKCKQLAKAALTNTATDQAIAAADICVDTLLNTDVLHTSDPAQWAVMQQMVGGLIQAGVVSQASFDAWKAMRSQSRPIWPLVLTVNDIIAARSL